MRPVVSRAPTHKEQTLTADISIRSVLSASMNTFFLLSSHSESVHIALGRRLGGRRLILICILAMAHFCLSVCIISLRPLFLPISPNYTMLGRSRIQVHIKNCGHSQYIFVATISISLLSRAVGGGSLFYLYPISRFCYLPFVYGCGGSLVREMCIRCEWIENAILYVVARWLAGADERSPTWYLMLLIHSLCLFAGVGCIDGPWWGIAHLGTELK